MLRAVRRGVRESDGGTSMISFTKSARVLAVVAASGLVLSACGSSDSGGSSDGSSADESSASASSELCGKNLAFLGALTGDAGALGQNMVGGIEVALKEFNDKNADCQIGLKKFDSQGSPDTAPGLATQIVNDDTIFGLIGPGFSGESLA